MKEFDDYRLVFIGGLHRSGTSPLHRALSTHPDISCFKNTGVPEDEGQHLQNVYPPASKFGGAGRFGFYADSHMTEKSPLITKENRKKIVSEWSRYWDLSKPVLVEKSPPNIIRSLYLQSLFPNSWFIFIIRHPIPTALATIKWSRTSLTSSIEHWITCHDILINDLNKINRYFLMRYEDFVDNPKSFSSDIANFLMLGEDLNVQNIENYMNDKYFAQWDKLRDETSQKWMNIEKVVKRLFFGKNALVLDSNREIADIEIRFEHQINKFGYSFHDFSRSGCFKRIKN